MVVFSFIECIKNNKIILITGGTGSFGTVATKYILENFKPKKIIIYSRDEFKQYSLQKNIEKKYQKKVLPKQKSSYII